MTLQTGVRLGPYEIAGPLGAGGMGEVYRARDTRLDRTVAIKVLPAELSQNAQFRSRFEREAKVISSLNHPNICTLHDIGHDSGIDYLVMELVEGESLAERTARGPLPLAEVLRLGSQIAEALDKAHRAGIVHRDLKPGNVMITRSGAKLLDFGLAKSAMTAGIDLDGATQHKPLTAEGTIVGTFQYMAPEQLEGLEADARTDIFALGAVLYEMATGRRAFDGKTKTSLIAAIVGGTPPPIRDVQPLMPAAFDHVVEKCLEKDREDRWQCAHDVAGQLRWLSVPRESETRRSRSVRWFALAALTAALAGLAGFLAARSLFGKPAVTITSAASIMPPPGVALVGNNVLSPDGHRVAFVAVDQGVPSLWLRTLGAFDAHKLEGTQGAGFPFWSPDGASIAFFAHHKLNRVPAAGGSVQAICEAAAGRGGSWNGEGTIIFAPDLTSALSRVPAAGGAPIQLIPLAPEESSQRWPFFLPDGHHFLFFSRSQRTPRNPRPYGIYVASTDSPGRKLLATVSSNPVFVAPSHLLYLEDGNVVVQRLNLKTLALEGDRTVVAEGVDYNKPFDYAGFSATGDVLVFQPSRLRPTQLMQLDRSGRLLRALGEPSFRRYVSLSPDGKQAVEFRMDPRTQEGDLFLLDLERGGDLRVTSESGLYSRPVWSPDGRSLLYSSSASSSMDLFVQPLGSAAGKLLLTSPRFKIPCDWSRDGQWILYEDANTATGWDLWLLHAGHNEPAVPFLKTKYLEVGAAFSPDGRWVAYASDETGEVEVYLRSRDGGGETRVSTHGGAGARWRADGRELFYLTRGGTLMATAVETEPSLRVGTPQPLFETTAAFFPIDFAAYAPAPDGQSFFVSQERKGDETQLMNVVINWKANQK